MTAFPRPHFRKQAAAFSLIELIAVATVLLILTLLATSVIGGLRKRSLSSRCVHNLRQVGVALFAFAADNRQMLPPRRLGLYRTPALSGGGHEWVNRLIHRGYVTNPDILYCPAFTPFTNERSSNPLPADVGPFRTYGIRTWVPPGHAGFGKHAIQEEDKPLALIAEPADFFIVADSVWIHPTYRSQGYGINPGMGLEQLIHLRHNKMANALFADGHVEGKPASYFEDLSKANRQRAYSGGKDLPFGVIEEVDF